MALAAFECAYRQAGLSPPPGVARRLQQDPTTLDLSAEYLTCADVEAVLLFLEGFRGVRQLNLSGTALSVAQQRRLLTIFATSRIESISLARTSLELGSIEALKRIVQQNEVITSLNLSGCTQVGQSALLAIEAQLELNSLHQRDSKRNELHVKKKAAIPTGKWRWALGSALARGDCGTVGEVSANITVQGEAAKFGGDRWLPSSQPPPSKDSRAAEVRPGIPYRHSPGLRSSPKEDVKAHIVFTDEKFQPTDSGLPVTTLWRRASEVAQSRMGSGTTVRDIQSTYMCEGGSPIVGSRLVEAREFEASVTVLQHADRIRRVLCARQDPEIGQYVFRFFRHSAIQEVAVDDCLPVFEVDAGGRGTHTTGTIYVPAGMHHRCLSWPPLCNDPGSDTTDFWCSLLEKAYAKLLGGYHRLSSVGFDEALADLSSGFPIGLRWSIHAPILSSEEAQNSLADGIRESVREKKRLAIFRACPPSEASRLALLEQGVIPFQPYVITDILAARGDGVESLVTFVQLSIPLLLGQQALGAINETLGGREGDCGASLRNTPHGKWRDSPLTSTGRSDAADHLHVSSSSRDVSPAHATFSVRWLSLEDGLMLFNNLTVLVGSWGETRWSVRSEMYQHFSTGSSELLSNVALSPSFLLCSEDPHDSEEVLIILRKRNRDSVCAKDGGSELVSDGRQPQQLHRRAVATSVNPVGVDTGAPRTRFLIFRVGYAAKTARTTSPPPWVARGSISSSGSGSSTSSRSTAVFRQGLDRQYDLMMDDALVSSSFCQGDTTEVGVLFQIRPLELLHVVVCSNEVNSSFTLHAASLKRIFLAPVVDTLSSVTVSGKWVRGKSSPGRHWVTSAGQLPSGTATPVCNENSGPIFSLYNTSETERALVSFIVFTHEKRKTELGEKNSSSRGCCATTCGLNGAYMDANWLDSKSDTESNDARIVGWVQCLDSTGDNAGLHDPPVEGGGGPQNEGNVARPGARELAFSTGFTDRPFNVFRDVNVHVPPRSKLVVAPLTFNEGDEGNFSATFYVQGNLTSR